jgi:hypothetical protein
MTREDILKLAREAGWSEIGADLWGATNDGAMSTYALKRFAVLAYAAGAAAERKNYEHTLALQQQSYEREIKIEVEAEREACAKVCEDKAKETFSGQCQVWGDYFTAAIRARGNK